MKKVILILAGFILASQLTACGTDGIEELTFRKVLEYQLEGECGDTDVACQQAVEEQIQPCMEKADWRSYLENDDDEEELKRFSRIFYACIVDADGNPYFESSL